MPPFLAQSDLYQRGGPCHLQRRGNLTGDIVGLERGIRGHLFGNNITPQSGRLLASTDGVVHRCPLRTRDVNQNGFSVFAGDFYITGGIHARCSKTRISRRMAKAGKGSSGNSRDVTQPDQDCRDRAAQGRDLLLFYITKGEEPLQAASCRGIPRPARSATQPVGWHRHPSATGFLWVNRPKQSNGSETSQLPDASGPCQPLATTPPVPTGPDEVIHQRRRWRRVPRGSAEA